MWTTASAACCLVIALISRAIVLGAFHPSSDAPWLVVLILAVIGALLGAYGYWGQGHAHRA